MQISSRYQVQILHSLLQNGVFFQSIFYKASLGRNVLLFTSLFLLGKRQILNTLLTEERWKSFSMITDCLKYNVHLNLQKKILEKFLKCSSVISTLPHRLVLCELCGVWNVASFFLIHRAFSGGHDGFSNHIHSRL